MENLNEIMYKEANKSQMNKKYACAIFNRKGEIIALGHNDYRYSCPDNNCLLRT